MNHSYHQSGSSPHTTRRTARSFGGNPSQARHIIGDRVRAARFEAKMTQTDLAGNSYSKSYISAIERAKMTPSIQTLMYLSERVGVPLAYLLGEDAQQQSQEMPLPQTGEEEQEAVLSEARRLLEQGRYEEAITLFEQTGQKDALAGAHEQYAHFLAAQERYQEAYEHMRLAL